MMIGFYLSSGKFSSASLTLASNLSSLTTLIKGLSCEIKPAQDLIKFLFTYLLLMMLRAFSLEAQVGEAVSVRCLT
jgi:hypothetical protein